MSARSSRGSLTIMSDCGACHAFLVCFCSVSKLSRCNKPLLSPGINLVLFGKSSRNSSGIGWKGQRVGIMTKGPSLTPVHAIKHECCSLLADWYTERNWKRALVSTAVKEYTPTRPMTKLFASISVQFSIWVLWLLTLARREVDPAEKCRNVGGIRGRHDLLHALTFQKLELPLHVLTF